MTDYKVVANSGWNRYENTVFYFLGSIMNLGFYGVMGDNMNSNVREPIDNISKIVLPILGFNFKNSTKFFSADGLHEWFGKLILGPISTKMYLNGFSNNNSDANVGVTVFNVLMTGLKFVMIAILGTKYNKWYEYMNDGNQYDWKRLLTRVLFSGLDFDKSEAIYKENKSQRKGNKPLRDQPAGLVPNNETGILYEDQLDWSWGSGIVMFFVGVIVSLFTGMDYLTNSGKISALLSSVK